MPLKNKHSWSKSKFIFVCNIFAGIFFFVMMVLFFFYDGDSFAVAIFPFLTGLFSLPSSYKIIRDGGSDYWIGQFVGICIFLTLYFIGLCIYIVIWC